MIKTKNIACRFYFGIITLIVGYMLLGSFVHGFDSWGPRGWFSASAGITQSSNLVSQRQSTVDPSNILVGGYGNSSLYPVYTANGINGLPVINFTYNPAESNDRFMLGSNIFEPKNGGRMFFHIFSVVSLATAGDMSHIIFQEQHDGDKNIGLKVQNGGNIQFLYGGAGDGKTVSTTVASTNFTWNKPNLISALYASTTNGGAGAQIKVNGNLVATKTTNQSRAGGWDGVSTNIYRGRMNGSLAESLIFRGYDTEILSSAQKNQIESYFMIKYGIAPHTSNTNLYNTSNGLVWNAATNASYNNSIFGIGRDTTSRLNSTTSESTTNTTLKIQASTTLTNQQYLMMGDDNGGMSWGSTASNAPINMVRLARMWYVQKTGPTDAYTTTISIPTSQLPTHASNQYYVAVDTDTDFSNSTIYPATNVGGRWTAAGVTINNASFVTFIAGVPAALVGDRVWIDANNNGIQDEGEVGLGSVTVTLKSCGGIYGAGTQPPTNYNGTVIATTTTNAGGSYNFTVAPGVYYVEFLPSSSYKFAPQHAGGYGTNITTNSDAHPHSGKTRCENFASNSTDNSMDAGVITQTYSSCDSLTLSNVITVGPNRYQKPGVSFTATLAGYGQNASLAGTNVAGGGSNTQAPGVYNRSPSMSSSIIGTWTINGSIDGYNYKLDYYNNPAAYTNSCMYRTISAGVFCAERTALAPFIGSSVNMNSSPTTISPITYCTPAQTLSNGCTAPIDAPQSSLVRTDNTCTQNITIMNEATICNSLVSDMSAADCNGLIALYNSAGGASWTNKTNWLFNGDTTWTTACDWFGVACAGGRLISVGLGSNNMGGTLPTLPAGAWTALTDVSFVNNNIGGSLPSAWSTLTAMRYFNVANNVNLNTTLPTAWSTWTQMLGFWIYATTPGGTIPTQWSTWTQLQTFDANSPTNGVGFNGTLPASWSSMTNLRGFYVFNHKLDGTIPTQWSSMTQMRSFMAHNNNLDGPIPSTVESWTLLDSAGWNSVISSNCMGTGHVGGTLLTHLNSRFAGTDPATWNNAAAYGWRTQKACATDIRITSAVITAGDLVNGNTATYSVTVNNNGSRWAYAPHVAVSIAGGLVASSTTLVYGTLAPGASQTLTFTVTKGSVTAGTNNITNTFVLSDASISDPTPGNNTVTSITSVRGSSYTMCNNSSLTVPTIECESLNNLYASTNGVSWVNKTNWTTNPDISTWFGVTTASYTDGPFMRFTFDDSTVVDKSSNGRNGTIVGGTTFTAGKFGNAARFDGLSNSRVTTVSTAAAGNNITWSAWINREQSTNAYNMFMGQWLPYAAFRSDGYIMWSLNINGVQQSIQSASNAYVDNTWYFVTMTYDGSTIRLYVDGALSNSQSQPGTLSYSNTFSIGDGYEGAWYPFKGMVDDVRVYNRVLTPVEIAQLYNSNEIKNTVRSLNLNPNGVCGRGTDAATNNMIGTLPASLGNLGSLDALCFAYNPGLVGGLPSTFGNLRLMNNLVVHSNVNLKGQLPANITQMSPSTLWMPSNGFTGNLNALGSWNRTVWLGLYNNGFTGPIPSTVSNMTAMYYFHLNNNPGLTGPLPSQLFSLPNIGYVILSSNNLNTSVPTLTYNPSLFYIDLNSAGIVGNPFAELVKMTNLTQLHVGGNPSIGGSVPSTINNLNKLTHLNISANGMSNTTLPNITIPTLQYLWANTNGFTGSLPSLPASIRNFEAQDNMFKGTLPVSYGSLTNLQYLYLRSSQLEGAIPSSWAGMTQLRRLGLGNNNLEGVMPVSTFQAMTSLDTNLWGSMLGNNCFYNGSLTVGERNYMDTKFSHWLGDSFWEWRNQKACGTDLEVVSATPSGTLQNGSQIAYTVTIRNNGPRIAYDPKFNITLTNGLQFNDSSNSTKTINLGQMTAGQTIVQTIIVNKLGVGSTTINYTNTFAVADTSTSDPTPANNSKSHAGTANGSAYPICLNPTTNVIQSDCEALGDLYTATAGANWTRKANWLSATDVSTWQSVTISAGRVINLDLSVNNLNGSLPASIGNLTMLRTLYLSENGGLTGPIPSTIDQLDELTHLYFHYTAVNGSLPTTIGGMAKMSYLYGFNTQISGIPSQIANLPIINQLQFQGNPNTTSLPDMTALNDTLRVFFFHSNGITGPIPSWMGNMTNLQYFYIGYNPFTAGGVPAWICNMTSLQDLYIAGNNLNGTMPTCFNNAFPQMRAFQIQGNQIEGLPPTLSNSSSLTHYYIHSNLFSGPLPSWMANIATFRYLYMDSNRFTGPIPANFANMSTASIIFRVSSNYLDRDASNNALISPALQTWWNNIVVYNNDPTNYKLIGGQGDITTPLLGTNAKRLPAYPLFNYNGQPMSTAIITGPNGSNVEAILLGGSPYHVGYDNGDHGITFQNSKTYTLSFWARTTAGTRTINPALSDNTNDGLVPQVYNIDTTWKQITVRKTYAAVGANPRVFINYTDGGTAFYYYDPIVTESTDLPTAIDTNRISVFDPVVEGSDFATAGVAVSVGGGGTCSNLLVTPNALNSKNLPQAASQFNPDNGLIVHYGFEGSSATDNAGGDNNGAPINISYVAGGRITTGIAESAAGGYISHSTNGLSPTNGTISVWLRPTVLSSWGIWQTHNGDVNPVNWISMFSWTNENLYFRMGDGISCCSNDLVISPTVYITPSAWNHLTFTWQGNADGLVNDTMNIYVNGRLVGTRTANLQGSINPIGLLGYGHARDLDGTLDDFRAYNRALSAAEVVNLYNERSINIAAQGSYAGCYLITTDRGSNTSNAVRLGDFTATFSPYPICNNPARTVPQSECTALMDLYTSAGGASWTNKTNWGTSPDIDSWFGIQTVTVGSDQRVSAICINRTAGGAEQCGYGGIGNNMIGTLPASIGSFPYLTTLGLSDNDGLTGPIPTGIGNLTNLVLFQSTQTSLNGTLPDSMVNLNNLTNLYLWGNDLSGNLPSAWGAGMNSINYIHLDSNLLSGPIPASWANFADTMTALVLSSQRGATKLNGTLPSWLGNFTKISWVFYFHGNQFTGPIPSTLGNLTGAVQMYLSSNQLTGPIPPELGNMKALTHLGLQGNQLVGALPTNLSNLTNLTDFYVHANYLDRDLSNNALIPAAITTWYNARATKDISAQTDVTAPVISGNPLAGIYSFATMSYTINMTEGSTIAGGGQTVTVGGGGTCSQLTVAGTLTNGAGANVITLQFAPGGNATTAYSNCTLTTTDRASLVSNTINLGNFSVKLNPFPICNNVNLTVSQEQCGVLMDFYTNLGGASWTNKTNWSAGTTVGNWHGVTTANSLIGYYSFDTNNASDSGPLVNNGSLVNSPTFVAGRYGNAINFDGTAKRVVINNTNIPKGTSDFTYSWWTKWNGTPTTATASYFENGTWGNSLIIRQETAGLIYIWSMGAYRGAFNFTPTVGQRYHLSIVRSGNTMLLYIDGVQAGSITFNVNLQPSADLWIGASQHSPTQALNAAMDEVRIFNRALSLDEVNQLYLSNTMGAQSVTQLRFTGANNMIGTFPNVFDRLPNLTAIEIVNNAGITGPIPATISNLPKLIELGLQSLGINGSLPSTLPTTLTSLSINNILFTAGPLPSAWSLLTNLNYLSVQNINAIGALPASWSALTNLTYLHLANNNFNGQIPTSWLTALTNIGQMYWEGANIDGPLPPEMATWNTNTAYTANHLNNNCFGTGHLTPAQVNAFDTKYTRAKWAPQRQCTTDLQISISAVSNVSSSNGMLYTIAVTNAGSRWAYSPRVAVNLQQGLVAGNSATPTIMYSTLAPGASQTQTISVIKSASSPTTATSATNTFTVSDPTITDSNAGNNSTTHATVVKKSNISAICDHYALNTTIAECEALTNLYSSTAGPSWTNRSNWISSPNTDNWYGITTSLESDLIAHYSFDSSNATDDAGVTSAATVNAGVTFESGRLGSTATINGGGNGVTLPSTITLGNGNWTTSAWVRTTDTTSNYGTVLSNNSGGPVTNALGVSNGKISYNNYNGARQAWGGTRNVADGQRHFLTWVNKSNNTMDMYVDGTLDLGGFASITSNGGPVNSIGRNWYATFSGSIDDVRIYNRGLTAGEITNLYQTASPTTDRVVSLQLGNGGTYSDAGGNNLSGTIPSNLSNLTELRYLWLNGNSKLIGAIPSDFWNLTKLEEAILFWTQLSGNLPTFGSSFSALRSINISHTRVSGSLPTTWAQNTALNNIWLGVNPFGAEIIIGNLPSSWGSLVNLNSFATYYAGLTGSIPSTWGGMTNMVNFQLQGNQLSGPLPTTLSQWVGPNHFIINTAQNTNQFTGNLAALLSGWNTSALQHFMVYGANFDRDSNNDPIIPANVQSRVTAMGGNYLPGFQGDIMPPVLTFGSMATNVDDVVQINFTLTEGSSTTGAGYLSGLDVSFTGSTACASLDTSPVRLINKGSLVIDVIGAAGTYPGCSLFVTDRANNRSNLMSPGTITIPNYAICGTATDISRNDCRALVDLYTSTAGSGWTNKTNWMGLGDATPTTASDWRGVTLASNRVTSLKLSQGTHPCGRGGDAATNNMIGTLPTSLGNLTGLTELCIAYNPNLTGGLPSTIGNLTALTNFVVHSNGIGGNLPASFSNLNPNQAVIYSNGFTGPVPSLANRTNLTYLYLYSNNFGGNSLPVLPTTAPNINTVHLGHAGFSGVLPSSYSSLTAIQYLLVHDNNNLSGPIPSSWGNLTNLRQIYLQGNNLKGLIPLSFANLTNLNAGGSYIGNNCLSAASSYMSAGLSTILSTKFDPSYTSQKNCGGTIGSRLWIDSDNDGLYDNGETGTGGVTVTLRSCSAQAPVNTGGKLLNHQLAAHYTFDANNTIDDSFNSNDGVNNGATFAAGKMGSAATSTAGTAYIRHSTKGLNSTQGTISAWVNPSQVYWGLWQTHDSSSENWTDWISLFSWWGGTFYFRMGNGTDCCSNDLTFTTATYMPLNTWSHIAATWSGRADGIANDEMMIYVNGVLVAYRGNVNFQGIINPDARMGMGHSIGMYGSVDDFRAYGRALTASEISQLYTIDAATPAINFPISNSGAAVATTTSAANGTYSFTNQPAGRYYLEYSNLPNGYKFANQNWGGYHNSVNSDVNPWSAKTSCFELYNGLYETNINAGIKHLPYSSCENTSAAFTPILLGQPVTLSIGGYGTNGQIQAINTSNAVVLNQSITNQGTNWGLKTWSHSWTPSAAGTYTISGAVDGYNYKLDYYNNPALSTLSCAYRTISAGNWCAVQATTSPYSGTVLTNVNQIVSIPAPMQYCTAPQISGLPCSTAGDQPPAMVVQVPNTCTSTMVVTSDVNVMCDAVTDMQPAECKALVSLYDSTAGASWTNKTNRRFLGDTTPRTACDWTGITCAGGRATQIALSSNNLNGTLPPLTGLNQVIALALNSNSIKGNLPFAWATTLPAIKSINLGYNQLTGSLPTAWSTITGVNYIGLEVNGLDGALPTAWSTMTGVTQLVLRGNQFAGTLPSSWSALRNLRDLSLSSAQINGNLPASWSALNKLQNLTILNSQITGQIPSSWFTGMTAMRYLQLWDNQLDGPIPATGFQLWTGLALSTNTNTIGGNCMGITNVTGGNQSYMNANFNGQQGRWGSTAYWTNQDICQTDLQLSLVTKTGSLDNGNSLTYTLRYTNAGSRWSYNTILGLTTDSRINIVTGSSTVGATRTGINLGILAPGVSGTIVFTIGKAGFSGGLYNNIASTRTLTDTTISDVVSNHTYSDTITVDAANYPVCNDALLTISIAECKALMTIYDNMNGANWTIRTGWGIDPNVENRHGVDQVANRVGKIMLTTAGTAMWTANFRTNNNVIGAIPAIITNLTGLTHIDFHSKPGAGQLPNLGLFPNLVWLRCETCALTGQIPANISNTKLVDIYLSNNALTNIPSGIYGMSTLTNFSIPGNPIGGLLPTGFANMTGLQSLNLASSLFTGSIPASWSGMISLQNLYLGSNTLSKELPVSLQALTNLRILQLSDNQLEGVIPPWLTGLVNLQ